MLTEIDVRATLREKIEEEIEDYVILGACNPRRAAGVPVAVSKAHREKAINHTGLPEMTDLRVSLPGARATGT